MVTEEIPLSRQVGPRWLHSRACYRPGHSATRDTHPRGLAARMRGPNRPSCASPGSRPSLEALAESLAARVGPDPVTLRLPRGPVQQRLQTVAVVPVSATHRCSLGQPGRSPCTPRPVPPPAPGDERTSRESPPAVRGPGPSTGNRARPAASRSTSIRARCRECRRVYDFPARRPQPSRAPVETPTGHLDIGSGIFWSTAREDSPSAQRTSVRNRVAAAFRGESRRPFPSLREEYANPDGHEPVQRAYQMRMRSR